MKKRLITFLTAAVMIFTSIAFVSFPAGSIEAQAADSSNVAEPVHDFSYNGNDTDSALFSGKYYKTNNAYFKDEANVFNDDSYYGKFYESIQAAADETGMNLAVFLGGLYRSDPDTEEFTRNSIKKLFGMAWDQNAVFLYLDFEGHSPSYDYICTCHDAKLYYPSSGLDDRIEEMIQNMYEYLPASGKTIYKTDVQKAINSFIVDIKYYKKEGPVWESSYYNEEKGCYRYVLFGNIIDQNFPPYKHFFAFLGIGIIVGIVIALYVKTKIHKEYKFRDPQKASAYTSQNRIAFNEVQDQFLHEHTTKTYIPPSSSGGGGGGGGGGSFGGGGGHR